MRFTHSYSQFINRMLIIFLLILLPINSYAENPLLLLKDKLQETLLDNLDKVINNEENNETLDQTSDAIAISKITVPSLLGQTPQSAEGLLSSRQLVLGKVVDRESTQPIGTIIAQSHAVNSEVNKNTAIHVEVAIAVKSKSKNTEDKEKPEVVEKTETTDKKEIVDNTASEKESETKESANTKVVEEKLEKQSTPVVKDETKASQKKLKVNLKLSSKKVAVGESVILQALVQANVSQETQFSYAFSIDGKMINSKKAQLSYKVKKAGRIIITASVREGNGAWSHAKSQWLEVTENNAKPDKESVEDQQTQNVKTVAEKQAEEAEKVAAEKQAKEAAQTAAEKQTKEAEQKQAEETARVEAEKQAAEQALKDQNKAEAKIIAPNVVGLSFNEAKQRLIQVGLNVGTITERLGTGLSLILAQNPSAGASVQPKAAINLVQSIKPNFKFELDVNKNTIKQNEPLLLKGVLTPEGIAENINYRFKINTQTYSTEQSSWIHRFSKSGNYQVIAEAIIDGVGVYSSTPIMIKVDATWQQPIAKIEPVTLIISKGDSATFKSYSSHDKKTVLSVYWMDESGGSGEEDDYTVETQNWEPGEYWVSLRVRDSQGFEHSDKAQLIVMSENGEMPKGVSVKANTNAIPSGISKNALSLSTNNYHVVSGKAMRFTIKASAQIEGNMSYRVYFGDDNVQETSRLWAKHRYASIGSYEAFVEANYQQQTLRSKVIKIWVWPSWFLLAVMGIGLFILAGLIKFFLKRTKTVASIKSAKVDYEAIPDQGEQRLEMKTQAAPYKDQ